MVQLNNENLEGALNTDSAQPQVSKEEEVGFHKGTVNTLSNERNELVKMIGNVDALMQMHLKRLKELGVDVSSGQEKKE